MTGEPSGSVFAWILPTAFSAERADHSAQGYGQHVANRSDGHRRFLPQSSETAFDITGFMDPGIR